MNYADWVRTFDPADIELLFVQDAVGQRWGCWPRSFRRRDFERMADDALASLITGCRHALSLPLSAGFLSGLGEVRREAEDVARVRLLAREKALRQRKAGDLPDWAASDLLAEVEAVCGEGKAVGRDVWFSCPWHVDRTPSLHVNPEKRLWHTFCCNRGGGVFAWRKAREAK